MSELSTADWIQIIGLAINAGLLVGLIVELWFARRSRDADLADGKKRSTLEAWYGLDSSIRDAERDAYIYFGRGTISYEQASEFDQLVRATSKERRPYNDPAGERDTAIIHTSEAVRSLLNSTNDFVIGVDEGAYDGELAYRLAGWRLSRVFRRYKGYIDLMRQDLGTTDVWVPFEEFVRSFLISEQAASLDPWSEVLKPTQLATRDEDSSSPQEAAGLRTEAHQSSTIDK